MEATPRTTEVLIIGGGPAGMISAIYLDRLGISSIVVERQSVISEHPKAHELSARSIEILRQLGFTLEELQREASPPADAARIVFAHTLREELGRIDLRQGGNDAKYAAHLAAPTPYLNLSQTELEKIMRRHLADCRHSQLLLAHEWKRLQEGPAGIKSTIQDCAQGTTFCIQSGYVIGADGAGSPCRKALGIPMQGAGKLADFISVYFQYDLRNVVRTPAKLYWIMNPATPGTFIAHHIEKRWVYHFPFFPPYEKKEDYTPSVLRQRILTALGDDSIPLEITSISHWRMSCQVAAAFRRGRVFLVGDAAHRFPPTGGLGMNSGIGDAHNLCWKLALVLRGAASAELLDSYETERRPVIERNSQESLQNYRNIWAVPRALGLNPHAMRWQARLRNSTVGKWLPAWTNGLLRFIYHQLSQRIRAVPHHPAAQHRLQTAIDAQTEHFDRIGLDLGYTYAAGALARTEPDHPPDQTVSAYQPSVAVGVRFPHFWISVAGTRTSSHNWLRPDSFTLLCNAAGATWWAEQQTQLRPAVRARIHVVNVQPTLDQQPVDAPEKAFYDHRAIPLLLVRPDGQIAWRSSTVSIDITSVMNLILPPP